MLFVYGCFADVGIVGLFRHVAVFLQHFVRFCALRGLFFIHILEFVGGFAASSKIVQQMHVKTALFLGHFQMYCQKVQLLPSYAGNKKTMIILTIAFVSCFSWLRSGIERYADRKLSPCCQFFVSGFVGLLTYPFTCGEFFSHKRIVSAFSLSHDSSSNDRFSSHARFALHGNNPLEIQLLFKSYLSLALAEKADSFRVRDSHPIPLFSEQACVSD